MTTYRFALLGAGFIGSVHAANLASHPGIDFCVVYDIDSARANRLAAARYAGYRRPRGGIRRRPDRRCFHRLVHRYPCRLPSARR